MKIKVFLMGLLLAAVANAQTVYHDASAFPLLGKATESTLTRYERLPDSLQDISRKPLWDLGRKAPDWPCVSVPTPQALPPNGR